MPRASALCGVLALVVGCGPPLARPGHGPGDGEKDPEAPAPIVTTERGSRGGHLVFVAENGARVGELTGSAQTLVQDITPATSPDGRWVVFASSRSRAHFAETSLWIVAAHPGATPQRLTTSGGADRNPAWITPDTIVFASSRAGTFDLYRARLVRAGGRFALAAPPSPLTRAATHELSPAVAPGGGTIVYAAVDAHNTSTLWLIPAAGGTPRKLTDGPADLSPAFFPDGRHIAFAAPAAGRKDTDIYVIDADGGGRRLLLDEPLGDETGPVLAAGGRFLFATSVYRSVASGRPVLSSVVVVDLATKPRVFRALHDPVAVDSRIGVALLPGTLDGAQLAGNATYREALLAAVVENIRREIDRAQPDR